MQVAATQSPKALSPGGPPLPLIPDVEAERRLKIEQVSARISERFGDERTVMRATLLKKPPPAQ